jgi:hypothetical protein
MYDRNIKDSLKVSKTAVQDIMMYTLPLNIHITEKVTA